MTRLEKLRQQRTATIRRMRELLNLTEGQQGRNFTKSEDEEYRSLELSITAIEAGIDREERLVKMEIETGKEFGEREDGGFSSFGEFLATVLFDRRDIRLMALTGKEERGQQMVVGSLGGFMVPDQFRSNLFNFSTQDAIVRPRATVIEAGYPPDAKTDLPTLDQDASRGQWGGIVVYHDNELVSLRELTMYFKLVPFEPKRMSAYCVLTNDLLRNWRGAGSYMTTLFRAAIAGTEDYDFLRGNGVNRAVGVSNDPSAIKVDRTSAGQIVFADIAAMLKRVKMGGDGLYWLANQLSIEQIGTLLTDTGGKLTMLGVPLIWSENSPTIGSEGDLILSNLRYYGVKDGSLRIDLAQGQLFDEDKSAFRLIWNTDGHGLLSKPMTMTGSSSDTISPFVILK